MRRVGRWSVVVGTAAALVAVAGVVHATAAEQPSQSAAAQSADVRVYTTTVGAGASRSKGATASCHGKTVYGGGARVIGGGGRVSLTRLVPRKTSSGGEYQANAEVAPYYDYTVPWSLEVFAICGTALPGYRIVTQRATTPEPVTYLAAEAACPAGTKLLGTGGRVFGSGRAFLGAVKPLGDTRLAVAANHDPFGAGGDDPSEFTVDSIAVCAEPPPNYDVVWQTGADESAPVRVWTVTSACPAGTSAYGLGFSRFASAHHTRVDGMFPLVSSGRPHAARIRAEQPVVPPDTQWAIHRAAICAT